MAAPHNLGFSFAARLRMDQTDALMQWQIRSHHRHAAGVADVHGDGVGAFLCTGLFPLYKKFYS